MDQTVNKHLTLMKEAVHSSKTSVYFYRTTRRHIPKDGTHHYLVHRNPPNLNSVLSSYPILLRSVLILSLLLCLGLTTVSFSNCSYIFPSSVKYHCLHYSPTCFGPFRPSSEAASLLLGLLQLPVHVHCVLTRLSIS
jgi:hypothetical protein